MHTHSDDGEPFESDGMEASIEANSGNSGWLAFADSIRHAIRPVFPATFAPISFHLSSTTRWTPSNNAMLAGETMPSGDTGVAALPTVNTSGRGMYSIRNRYSVMRSHIRTAMLHSMHVTTYTHDEWCI